MRLLGKMILELSQRREWYVLIMLRGIYAIRCTHFIVPYSNPQIEVQISAIRAA